MSGRITNFAGRYAFLSNFYPVHLTYKNRTYKSSEHAYQARKANNTSQHDFIAKAPSPASAKSRGEVCSKRADWEETKIQVMWEILVAKFENPMLRELLLDTGDAELVEGNTWGDVFWGVCGGVGENWLGKLLMKLRTELRLKDGAKEACENLGEDLTGLSDERFLRRLAR